MKPRICTCTECRNLDRLHPKEGRQLVLFPARRVGKSAAYAKLTAGIAAKAIT